MTASPVDLGGTWQSVRGVLRWSPDVTPAEVTDLQSRIRGPKPTRLDPTLIACPTCLATVTQACRTAAGNATHHEARIVSRRCLCGAVLEQRKMYCEPCRVKARRRTYRLRELRKSTARRRVA